ncbi:MAG: cyclodeaminase/cyclohydrolase family protein [Dethiobacteria bacterium]
MLKEISVDLFIREAASSTPVPNGSSIAALAGAQAAALLSMYCNLSMDRKQFGDIVDLMHKTGEEARFICVKLLEGADISAIIFNQSAGALKMPQDTNEQIENRNRSLQEAAARAVKVALRSTWGCLRILYLINEVANKGNKQLTADLGVANLQSYSGAVGTCYSLNSNLEQFSDQVLAASYRQEAGNLLGEAQRLYDLNREMLEELLKHAYPVKGGLT